MNFTQVTAEGGAVELAGVRLPAPVGDGPVVLGIRPTAFAPAGRDGWPTLSVVPQVVEDLGDERMVIFELDSPPVDTDAVRAAFDASDRSDLALLGEAKARFTARVPGDVPVTMGEPLVLAVDPSRLYFFDTESGAAIGG
jgi:multiple sugar transport system ATP-binding protein